MDLARDEEGAQVTALTSNDPRYPGSNILDGDQATYWATTGNFPQEIVIQLASTGNVSRIKLWTFYVKHVSAYVCSASQATKWAEVVDEEIPSSDGQIQIESYDIKRSEATFVKIIFHAGYKEFIKCCRISVEGAIGKK